MFRGTAGRDGDVSCRRAWQRTARCDDPPAPALLLCVRGTLFVSARACRLFEVLHVHDEVRRGVMFHRRFFSPRHWVTVGNKAKAMGFSTSSTRLSKGVSQGRKVF